jgi:hypothetical protein
MLNTQPHSFKCMYALSVCVKGIGKVTPVHAIKSYRENGSRHAPILRLCTDLSILLQYNSVNIIAHGSACPKV